MQLVSGFSAVVIALVGAIYALFKSTIQLRIDNIDFKIESLKSDLNTKLEKLTKEIEHSRNEKNFLESIINSNLIKKRRETDS